MLAVDGAIRKSIQSAQSGAPCLTALHQAHHLQAEGCSRTVEWLLGKLNRVSHATLNEVALLKLAPHLSPFEFSWHILVFFNYVCYEL